MDESPQPQPKFGSRPINLLSQKGLGKPSAGGRAPGVKRDFRPLITTDEDQLDSLFLKNDKGDAYDGPSDAWREPTPDHKVAGGDRKKPSSFLQVDLGEEDDTEDDPALHRTNPLSQNETGTGGEP